LGTAPVEGDPGTPGACCVFDDGLRPRGVTGGGGAALEGCGDVDTGGGSGEEAGELLSGTSLMSTTDWRIGPEISRFRKLCLPISEAWLWADWLEGVGLGRRFSGVFSRLLSTTADADRFTLDPPPSFARSLDNGLSCVGGFSSVTVSGVAIGAATDGDLEESDASMWHMTASEDSGFGSVDHVGVKMVAVEGFCFSVWSGAASSGEDRLPVMLGWWMMGGLLGLVGLGRVIGSQKTTPRELLSLLSGLSGRVERIEYCETPVHGALLIKADAEGVAAWKTGLLISGLPLPFPASPPPGSTGSVDDFDMCDTFPAALASEVGSVDVFVMLLPRGFPNELS
jgi:hypothetical protein